MCVHSHDTILRADASARFSGILFTKTDIKSFFYYIHFTSNRYIEEINLSLLNLRNLGQFTRNLNSSIF